MAKPTKLQLLAMGERLRTRREQLGMTQPEMAQALIDVIWDRHQKHVAISGDKVSKWERGESRPIPLYREAYRIFFNSSSFMHDATRRRRCDGWCGWSRKCRG